MIRKMVEDLAGLDDAVWMRYAFSREILRGRIDNDKRKELWDGAVSCGRDLAGALMEKEQGLTVLCRAENAGVKVRFINAGKEKQFFSFAEFTEPDDIVIYEDNAQAADQCILEEGLEDFVGMAHTADILLAHELFHFYEFSRPGLYTTQKNLRLWKIGPFHNDSTVACLGEIGAMAFTRELLGLNYLPYVFDVLMLYPSMSQRARGVYEHIIKLCGGHTG
jgi:hypothetical protein